MHANKDKGKKKKIGKATFRILFFLPPSSPLHIPKKYQILPFFDNLTKLISGQQKSEIEDSNAGKRFAIRFSP